MINGENAKLQQAYLYTTGQSDTTERRRQKRLRVQVPVKLVLPGRNKSILAMNQEISWGGAVFTTAEALPKGVDSVLFDMPWMQGQKISITANVLRTTLLPNNHYLVVVRFSSLTPESELRFRKLLKILRKKDSTGSDKESSDLFQELEVNLIDIGSFYKILEQISNGRCILEAVNGYEIDQSIGLLIEGPNNLPEIRLRAHIVDSKESDRQRFNGTHLHLVTMEFEHPREAVTRLIDSILNLSKKALDVSASVMPQRPSKKPGSSINDKHCELEIDFPGVLTYLSAVWNNHILFESFFLELLDVGRSGDGWPTEVFEELLLLKNVHDILSLFPQEPNAPPVIELPHKSTILDSVVSDTHCAIEKEAAMVTASLAAAWGDPISFESIFKKITFGGADYFDPGSSLSDDVWEELIFLQEIHEVAYPSEKTSD